MTIALDPGHGGHRPGAIRGDFVEAPYVLEFAYYLGARLRRGPEPVDVHLVREHDEDIPLYERGAITKSIRPDLILSFHVNASVDPKLRGLITFYWPGNPLGREVATAIARATPEPLYRERSAVFAATDEPGEHDDWLERPRAVLAPHKATAVLVELGYMSNAVDASALKCRTIRHGLAVAVEAGIARARHLLVGDIAA